MNEFAACKETWERLASTDPLWAILTDPGKSGRAWALDEFFETGTREIDVVFDYLRAIGRLPPDSGAALDFGCGVGRLTQALVKHFAEVHGVDISAAMIAEADRLNRVPAKCRYHHNPGPDLQLFETSTFSFIYTSIVLQHIPIHYAEGYVRELVRILRPDGTLVFQIPDRFLEPKRRPLSRWEKLRSKVRLRTRIRRILTTVRLTKPDDVPVMQMNCISENRIRTLVTSAGAGVVDVKLTNSTDVSFIGQLRFLEAEPVKGWISKQYCVVK